MTRKLQWVMWCLAGRPQSKEHLRFVGKKTAICGTRIPTNAIEISQRRVLASDHYQNEGHCSKCWNSDKLESA